MITTNEATVAKLNEIEHQSAESQIAESRAELRRIGEDLHVKGECLLDNTPQELVDIAHELQTSAMRLRRIAVELNSATMSAAQKIAKECR